MRDRNEVATLAMRRYPDVGMLMAIMFFENDRARAGLGALDERKRRHGGNVNNFKRWDFGSDQIRYHLVRHTPPRREYALVSMADLLDVRIDSATATVSTVYVPAVNKHLVVPVSPKSLRHQSDRRMVAAALRDTRRQLRTSPGTDV